MTDKRPARFKAGLRLGICLTWVFVAQGANGLVQSKANDAQQETSEDKCKRQAGWK